MALVGNSNEEKIWNYLMGKGLTTYGCAGLLGNLYAESGLNPQNLQNSYETKLGYTDSTYTTAVDNGQYTNFVRDSAGYGLAQWTYWSRKQNLLNYAKSICKSIGDLEMQLDFLYKELSECYKGVLSVLKTATTVKAASDSVLLNFERPADQSESAKTRRASYGQKYYDKYANTGTPPSTSSTPSINTDTYTETSIELLCKVNTQSSNLNIRKEPNTASTVLGSYKKGEIVQLIAKTSTGWYKTDKGYISGDYVVCASGKVSNCYKLNMRKEPKVVDGNVIIILDVGDVVELLRKESNGWYKVKTTNSIVGYVSGNYITIF